ncbi:hypothetical protein BCR37DRAFT_218940 [Protomyces lactucae-debilis]|uniref:Uncharacterized protein n=1 Tax=Protomyces lactucae-debilis TaxID=2754530 RepID=A0A1Y2FST1_PROLT|nr:uncharacterized protein BCR37DRAFT_218940 [Protomyces lactucae-debilis]ORY86374.1 hypothetical protein BCR37DRAFT_218940 [Protomyces lactucae-debilis]
MKQWTLLFLSMPLVHLVSTEATVRNNAPGQKVTFELKRYYSKAYYAQWNPNSYWDMRSCYQEICTKAAGSPNDGIQDILNGFRSLCSYGHLPPTQIGHVDTYWPTKGLKVQEVKTYCLCTTQLVFDKLTVDWAKGARCNPEEISKRLKEHLMNLDHGFRDGSQILSITWLASE